MNGDTFDALVIGGGINGLSALYHLKRLGAERVGLVERFSIGHDRGSSHGAARVTRSAYVAPEYVRLMQWVHAEEWPRIEKAVGKQLVYSNPGIYTGLPCERLDRYINAVQQVGVDVELISAGEARERFPQFTFVNAESALLDKTGGFVSAKEAVDSLAGLARENGVIIHENTIVHGIDPTSDPVRVETSAGTFKAERLIVAAGRFPVWVYMEQEENDLFYGMPEFGRAGVKVARHMRVGVDDDPDNPPDAIKQEKIDDVRRFMASFFSCKDWTLAGAENCLYTNAPNEDFIIDLHPENPRIAFGAGFSGHGFKFGPLTGRLLAELAWEGKTSIPEAEMARRLFSLKK